MSVNVSNKKYSILQNQQIKNKDITVTENGNYYAPDNYTGLGLVRVKLPEPVYEDLTINPSTVTQEFDSEYDGYSHVTANPVTSAIDLNIKPENIVKDITILGVTGNVEFVTEEIEINPSISRQEFIPDVDGYSKITVNPVTSAIDSNITSGNIKQGINILGVRGVVIEANNTTRDIYQNGLYKVPEPYTGFSEVNVNVIVEHEELNITPTTTNQTFTAPDDYHGYSPVNVAPVTSDIDSNIIPENIKEGISILGISGSCIEVNNTTATITENGVYTPESPYTGFSSVSVDINTVNNTDITITTNGTYIPEEPYTGFGKVITNVDTVNNTTLTVTASGTTDVYVPESPYTGFSSVTVNPAPLENVTFKVKSSTPVISTVTPSGTNYGLGSVTVDLSWILNELEELNAGDTDTALNLQDKTVTAAGTYSADSGYDGLGNVTVDLSWVDSAIEQAKTEACDGNLDKILGNSAVSVSTDSDIIRKYAFYYNTNLSKIILNNAESIGEYAFAQTNLSTLIINTQTVCTLENINAFTTTPNIYVPSGLVNAYKTATNWSNFASKIQSIS